MGVRDFLVKTGVFSVESSSGDKPPTKESFSFEGSEPDSAAPPTETPKKKTTPLDWSLDDVFEAAHIEHGKNTADAVLQIRDNIVSKAPGIPQDQVLILIRAMESADPSWDEACVLEDAKKRIAALSKFVQFIDKDASARAEAANNAFVATKSANDTRIQELDGQIAALQAEKERVAAETGGAKAQSEAETQTAKSLAEGKKQSVQASIAKYQGLLSFYGVK